MDILVVDDDPRIGKLHAKLLERAGFMVEVVDNGLAAFAALQQRQFRAIVCDIQMPFLEGTRLYDQIRQEFPAAAERVVFVTGWAHDPETRQFLDDTGRSYLSKPVGFEELVATVREVADRPLSQSANADVVKRVLLVDDQPGFRSAVRRTLEHEGYAVLEAGDGDDAIRSQRANPADLVITDMYMPSADGVDVIARFAQAFPHVPIVATSGGGHMHQEDVLAMARRLGAKATLAKPVSRDLLLTTVREVLEESVKE